MGKDWKLIIVSLFLTLICPLYILVDRNTENVCLPDVTENIQSESKEVVVAVKDNSGAVSEMQMDEYLTAVILSEMPVRFSDEALKSQAVVARTYTLRRVQHNTKHTECDVCTDPGCCQGFKRESDFNATGGKVSDIDKVKRAVADTRNLVLTYNGMLIDATYFSCSGGMTEDAVDVWGKDVPYLQSTMSLGEEQATHYTDTVRYSAEELAELLFLSTDIPPEQWVEDITLTDGGGVDEIRICGKIYKGTELRKLLDLRSTAFTIRYDDNNFEIETKGFGHRVGMSQYGAEAMAQSGATFQEILLHYYTGVKLSQYTPED